MRHRRPPCRRLKRQSGIPGRERGQRQTRRAPAGRTQEASSQVDPRTHSKQTKEKAMQIETQHHPELEKLGELIAGIKFAMITTIEADGQLRSRPMSCMQMDGDGNLWFFTSQSSGKVQEASADRHINLAWS